MTTMSTASATPITNQGTAALRHPGPRPTDPGRRSRAARGPSRTTTLPAATSTLITSVVIAMAAVSHVRSRTTRLSWSWSRCGSAWVGEAHSSRGRAGWDRHTVCADGAARHGGGRPAPTGSVPGPGSLGHLPMVRYPVPTGRGVPHGAAQPVFWMPAADAAHRQMHQALQLRPPGIAARQLPQRGEQPHLDLGQRVHVGVAQGDGALQLGHRIEQLPRPGDAQQRGPGALELLAQVRPRPPPRTGS